jgi:hypothetical protein
MICKTGANQGAAQEHGGPHEIEWTKHRDSRTKQPAAAACGRRHAGNVFGRRALSRRLPIQQSARRHGLDRRRIPAGYPAERGGIGTPIRPQPGRQGNCAKLRAGPARHDGKCAGRCNIATAGDQISPGRGGPSRLWQGLGRCRAVARGGRGIVACPYPRAAGLVRAFRARLGRRSARRS